MAKCFCHNQIISKPNRLLAIILTLSVGLLLPIMLFQINLPVKAFQTSQTIYVDRAAPDGGDGNSWETSYNKLQDALAVAQTDDEIWVASGVYTPGIMLTDTFNIPSRVKVYGGFAGGESTIEQRDWQVNITVLSGDIDGDDVTDENGVVVTSTNIVGDNAYHVVTFNGTTVPITDITSLDGFVITAGYAHGSSYPHNSGGGLFCNGQGNTSDCSPTLMNIKFNGNKAANSGGALFNDGSNYGSSSPTMIDVTFVSNVANYGGGLVNEGINNGNSNPVLTNATFSGNEAYSAGGAILNRGFAGMSSPLLTNLTFHANKARYYGGAIYNDGQEGNSNPILTNVTFYSNTTRGSGGAMYSDGRGGVSNPILTNAAFYGNTASVGGALHNTGFAGISSPKLTNVLFSGNKAMVGGAMLNSGLSGTSNSILTNVTFSHNTANLGGAIFNDCNASSVCNLSLTNVILWANEAITGTQIYNGEVVLTITNSLVDGGWDGIGVENIKSVVVDGGGNIDVNPLFNDADGADDIPGTLDDDLLLQIGSLGIDAGDTNANTTDFDIVGNTRVSDGDGDGSAEIDMGAYEAPLVYVLTVTLSGSGNGIVSSGSAIIDCGMDCVGVFPASSMVTLTAVPIENSVFTGWSGACSGSSVCVINMDATKEITAVFTTRHWVYLPLVTQPNE